MKDKNMKNSATGNSGKSKWFIMDTSDNSVDIRLFCFPYAGGGASIYRSWYGELDDGVDVCPVQLPGRENRIAETPFTNIKLLTDLLADAIYPFLDKPFVFFGHSMGSQIAFELAGKIKTKFDMEPLQLFISGCHAPHLNTPPPLIHEYPDNEFIRGIKNYGGTPEAIFLNKDLTELVLPALRADFLMTENYKAKIRKLLTCPITSFCGTEDHRYYDDLIKAWSRHTSGPFDFYMVPGDHFFIKYSEKIVIQKVKKVIRGILDTKKEVFLQGHRILPCRNV
jgi:medium-chain acyl-[acyl-carrier-protein] hydrolase